MEDKYNAFYNQYNGVANVGNTDVNKGECVGLVSVFMDFFYIPHVWGHAKDLFYNAPDQYFTKILNTIEALPEQGDIICWNDKMGGGFGHTGIASKKGLQLNFECFQQNDPLGSPPHLKTYTYTNVIGWLRVKNINATPQTQPEIIVGNDVAKYQGAIDWYTYNNNSHFAIMKATEGVGYTDSQFSLNQQEARRVGTPIGYYHFARPDLGNPAKDEVDWFLSVIGELREGEVLCLDYEANWGGDVVGWCKEFLDYMASKTNGTKGLIYLNQSHCKSYNWQPVIDGGYGLWIAAYTYSPLINTYQIGAWPKAVMQQWTNAQQVPGIVGNVDGDVFFGNVAGFKGWGYKKPVVIPPVDPCANEKTTITNLNQQIQSLTSDNKTLQDTVSNLKTTLTMTKDSLTVAQEQANKVPDLQSQINELTEKVALRDNEISVLQTQNGALQKQIDTIKSTLVPKKYLSLKIYNFLMALE